MASDEETMQYRMDRLCLDFAPPVLRELTKTYLKGCSVREHLAMLNIQEVDEKDKDCIKEMKKSCHLEDLDFTKLLILINTFQSSENGACIKKLRKIRNVAIHERSAKQFQDAEEILLSLAKFVDSQRKLKILYDETKTKIEGLKRTEVKLIQQQNKLRDRLRQGNKYVTDFFQPVIITGNISGCKNEERIREQLEIESASTSSKMVMDFDCSSSLCRKIENNNSIFTIRTAENVYSDKHFGDLLSKNPVWIYCNGYDKSSKQEEKEQLKIREWRLKRQKGISKAINEIKNRYAGSIKVIILVFEECAQNNPLFKVTRDLIENDYPDKCDVVIISDEEGFIQEIKKLTSDYLYEDQCEDLFVTGMGWDLVSDELKTSFKVNSDIDCILPCRGGNTVVMTRKERGVYTDLEIVSGEECMHQLEEMDKNMRTLKMEETKETFYRGKGISWWNFYFNGQVGRRSVFDDYCRIVRNRVEKGKNVERFVINHNPGAGGTTLGMHILWQFSQFSEAGGAANAYRCCKLIKITPGTKDQVVNLCMFKEKENQKPVILLIDDEHEDALNDFYDELYDEARKHSNVKILCCVVIVKRVPTDMSVKPPERLLSPHLKSDEKVWFDNKYKELEEEYNTVYVNSLISFNFLKNSYNPQAIQTTADRLIKDVKKEEKDILKCLSVIGTFERKRHAVPFRVFDCLMTGSLKNKTWNTCLSEAMNLLVTETQDDDAIGITVISQPLAKAILENFRRVEGINLEYVVRDLLDLLERNQANGTFFAQKLKRIIESLFKRDNERTGSAAAAKKDVFSALIHKLDEQRINETPESAHRRVLNELERCFELTEDPMVGQQIARFYNHIHKFSEAEKTIKKAIDMKPTSSCLLDTYGHIFKTKMSYLIKQGTDKEKTIPDINVSEIIDMAFEATAKFHEGQTLAYKEHLKSTKRNISPFYNELRTVIMLLEKFKTFESYTNHKDLLSYLNEPGLDVGESSYKGLVELSPKMLDLRQGTNYQVHLMEILQYTRDRTNQIKFYKVDSEEGDLILNFSERLARFYGDNKSTGHCYFTCPIDLKAMMDGMSSKKRRQSVIDRFETSKKNLESEVADIDDRDLLVYLGYKIIELSGRLPNTELCSEDEYKKFLRYSNCLVESQLQIPGRILLEVFLYHAMLHWPSDIRLSSDYDNFCPPRQYKAYLKQWEKNFYSNHFLQTTEQKEKNRPKTFFAFGKGSPGNDIINLKVIQQRIWQMEKDDERHLSGQASDEPWDEDIVKEQLKSFRGIVNGEGTALSHTITYSNERCSEIEIPMYKQQPELSNREVTFFLGFSWKGPHGLGVKDLAVIDEGGSPNVSPRSQPLLKENVNEQTGHEVVASPSVPKRAVPQKVVRPKTTRAPIKPVLVKDADQSKTIVEKILKEQPEEITVSCVCQQVEEAGTCVQLIAIYISPDEIYVYHLHEGDWLISDGQLIQLFADKGIHKVFFDIGMLSQTLIQQYETILEGNIWDVKVMVDYLSQVDPDDSDRDAKIRFSVWSQENENLSQELCKGDLDATVLSRLVDRSQHILDIFQQYKGKLDRSMRTSHMSEVRKMIFAQVQPSEQVERIRQIKEKQKAGHGKMQKGNVQANSSSQAQPKQSKASKKKKKK